jgi:uncharacterized protein YcgL (UPF0745 family)
MKLFLMMCFVYKSKKKSDAYLYVSQKDDFTTVPDALMAMLGTLEFVMDVDLNTRVSLAQSDIRQVREQLQQQGFYLQLPQETVFFNG